MNTSSTKLITGALIKPQHRLIVNAWKPTRVLRIVSDRARSGLILHLQNGHRRFVRHDERCTVAA